MSRGELALGLRCTNTGISREVLKLLHQDVINRLPSRVDTLKRRVREQLPLLELHKSVSLTPEKQPSSRGDPASSTLVLQPKEDLIFFNPINSFRRILLSNLYGKLHQGVAKFTNTPRESWQTDSWAGSIRTTCGEYAHIKDSIEPVFGSDTNVDMANKKWGRIVVVGRYYLSADKGIAQGQIESYHDSLDNTDR